MACSTKIDGIISESQDLIDMYIKSKPKSASTIMCALRRLIEETKITDVKDITYNDYLLFIKPDLKKASAILKKEFVRFLYAYNFLKNNRGFELEYWNPNEIIDNFEKDRKYKESTDYSVSLTFEQFEKIQQFISPISEDDFDNIKLELAFYMCFYTDIENIQDLRGADSVDYCDGIWTINSNNYLIPDRYKPYLLHLQTRNYSKVSRIHQYIKQLGDYVGIENLYPKDIIKARKQMQIPCFECGEKYFVFNSNWKSINGKILCNNCAERILNISDIKKNYIHDDILNFQLDILSKKEKMNNSIATTDLETLINDSLTNFDYKNLNEFLDYIGKLGEKYVYEKEKEKLKSTKYYDMVDMSPSLNNKNGFDILSYENNGKPLMIEVKTTTGSELDPFFVTSHELSTAKKAWQDGKLYKFFRVGNILNKDSISLKIYDKISEEDFEITGIVYKIKEKED